MFCAKSTITKSSDVKRHALADSLDTTLFDKHFVPPKVRVGWVDQHPHQNVLVGIKVKRKKVRRKLLLSSHKLSRPALRLFKPQSAFTKAPRLYASLLQNHFRCCMRLNNHQDSKQSSKVPAPKSYHYNGHKMHVVQSSLKSFEQLYNACSPSCVSILSFKPRPKAVTHDQLYRQASYKLTIYISNNASCNLKLFD